MSVLQFTKDVREAILDARAIRKRLNEDGHDWAPALANANAHMVALARGEEPRAQAGDTCAPINDR